MSIIIEEIENVTVRREVFASDICIAGNPENTAAGVVTLDLMRLEYHNDNLVNTTLLQTEGETVGDFLGREFRVNDKVITGVDMMLAIKQYVVDLYNERQAGLAPPTTD